MTFAKFSARMIELLKDAQDASDDADHIIAVSKMRACATDYLGDLKPTGTSEYAAMQSRAMGAGRNKTQAKRPAEKGMLF